MANRSSIRKQQDNRLRKVTPSDVYKRDETYIYRLINPDQQDKPYTTVTQILQQLSNNIRLISFAIERVKVVKSLWGDSRDIASIKGFKQRNATTNTIPDFDEEELRIDECYLMTKYPLEDQVEDDGTILETPDNQWWITIGRLERGKNKQVIFHLETMNSYDWQTQDDSSGIIINKEIELSMVNRRGESVKEFMIELDADALISLPSGIRFKDESGVEVDWNIDWTRTSTSTFDITHIRSVIDSGIVKIESHALSCFKFYDWLNKNSKTSFGIPYNTLRWNSIKWPSVGLTIGGTNILDDNQICLKGKETQKQIETEFIENMEYKMFLKNWWIDNNFTLISIANRDLSDDVKNNTIRNLIPDGLIAEVSSAKTITYNNGQDIILNPAKPATFDNENIDLNPWWFGDWKENRSSGQGQFPVGKWFQDSILQIAIGGPLKRKIYDIEYVKNTINNLLTGKTNTYKGIQINELPEVLTNIDRPDNYADFTEADRDHFVLSTFDIKNHYDENKDYYESLAPTRTNSLKLFASDKKSDRFDFLDPQSIKGLFLNFLWKQESGKKRQIYGTFPTAIKFPRTYDFKFIDGGKSYSIYQYRDENLNPALDVNGVEVTVISKKTQWYRSKDKRYVRNTGSFIESAIKGIDIGIVKTQ